MALMFLILFAGPVPAYARRDSDDRKYSGGGDNNLVCPVCPESSGYSSPDINGYQEYRNRYRMEFERKTPPLEEPVTLDQARFLVNNYLYLSGDRDLRSGQIVEKDNEFHAIIISKDGVPQGTLTINKQTGVIKSSF